MNPTSHRLIPSEQERLDLLRALTAWTSNPAIADDLVQQTMIEAWRSDRQPSPEEWRPWLFGVARMVLLRWRRELARDLRRSIAEPANESVLAAIAADVDIDTELEQQDIVMLLHDVLDELPIETRQVLLLKYIHELPQSEIAGQLGLQEKALEGRLHRGKQKLRQYVLQYKPDSAVSLGILTESETWQQTDIWCTTCGMNTLEARWYDKGSLRMDCPACTNGWLRNGQRSHEISAEVHNKYVPNRPAFRKAMAAIHSVNDVAMAAGRDGSWPCPNCHGVVRPQAVIPEPEEAAFEENIGIDLGYSCATCGCVYVWRFLPASGIYTTPGREFEQRNKRVRMLKPFAEEKHGRPAIRSTWEAIDGTAEFVTWYDLDTWRLLDAIASDKSQK